MGATKVVLDGTLFSECEMRGSNRDGSMRLTEDITNQLVLNKELDISFASSVYVEKYDKALKRFISTHYPDHINNIFSKQPAFLTNILKYKLIFRRKFFRSVLSPYYKEINNYDIFHSFYYPFPESILKNKIKRSITYLDIIPLKLDGYTESLKQRTKEIVECISGNYAISISEFSRKDLLNYDKRINPAKVFVVPLAASKTLFYQNNNQQDWKMVQKKYNLPDNYFLCVAGNDQRKNIRHVIKSFNNFILQKKRTDIYLVLTGNTMHNSAMLEALNISKPVKDKIFMPSVFIDSADLAVLYSNALSFFFMSLYEGFGLPALEAMQCGVPTVAANTTSLPEVVGNGGILLSPNDEDALSQVMSDLYEDETLRIKYSLAGQERAAAFSWERSANEYAIIFRNIANNFE